MKTCNRCGATRSQGDFHKRSRSSDGLQGHCKDCARKAYELRYADDAKRDRMLQANRDWHKANGDASAERHERYRRAVGVSPAHRVDPKATHRACPSCGESVPVENWASGYCKPCASAVHARWYARNRDRLYANITQYRRDNSERVRVWGRAAGAAYRARKLGATVAGVGVDHAAIAGRWAMWGGRCYLCMAKATETDHVIPLSSGGAHVPANLRPICRSCNASKSDGNWRAYATREVTI